MAEQTVLEIIECAECNLQNLKKLIPGIGEHPMFKIVEMQLQDGIKKMEGEE